MKIKIFLSLISLLSIIKVTAQRNDFGNMSYTEALKVSNEQIILSQQISKLKMVNAAKEARPELEEEMKAYMRQFEKNYRTLKSNSTTVGISIKSSLEKQNLIWLRYKRTIENPALFVNQLLDDSEELLIECNNTYSVVKFEGERKNLITYHKKNSRKKAKNIRLLDTQNLMIQKFCMYYAASKILNKGDKFEKVSNQYVSFYDIIGNSIETLENTEFTGKAIQETLNDMKELTSNLFKKKKELITAKIPLDKIVATTDQMVVLLDKATSAYNAY